VVPVLLYLRYVGRVAPRGYLKFTPLRPGVVVAIVLTALNL
jgi:hypothetical protein